MTVHAPAMLAFDPASLAALGVPVTSLALDSRRVQPGDVFVACPGRSLDGRAFIVQAIGQGAAAVIWDAADGFRWEAPWRVPNLSIDGLQHRLGALASHVYGHPSRSLSVIAVTGTNGKTSVTRGIAQALEASGRKCALVGTLGAGYPGDASMQSLANTTPDAVTLHAAWSATSTGSMRWTSTWRCSPTSPATISTTTPTSRPTVPRKKSCSAGLRSVPR